MTELVKVWDVRKFKEPIVQRDGFPTYHRDSNVIFSPDERYLAIGTLCFHAQLG